MRAWTGPTVALSDDEPARARWAEILALSERLAPETPRLPAAPRRRIEILGLGEEFLGEGGLEPAASGI